MLLNDDQQLALIEVMAAVDRLRKAAWCMRKVGFDAKIEVSMFDRCPMINYICHLYVNPAELASGTNQSVFRSGRLEFSSSLWLDTGH